MAFYSSNEKESILNAKRNEIESKTGKSLKDLGYANGKEDIAKAYPTSDKFERCNLLIRVLKATKVPRYVELARILDIINDDNFYTYVGLERREAAFIVEKLPQRGSIKTTFKEFQQLRKRTEKVHNKTLRSLKKYEEVLELYRKGMNDLFFDLQRRFPEIKTTNEYRIDSIVKEQQSEVVEFLNSREELSFVKSHSKLSRL